MLGLLALMRRISLYMAWLGGVLIICSALLVTTEVLLRQFFTISLGGADELSGYALGIASSFAFSFVLFERAHIRVDALMMALSPKAQVPLNLLVHILLVGFAAVVTMMVWSMVADTLEYGSRSIAPMRVPLIIPQGLWLLGWVFFVLSGIVIGLVAVWQTVRGDAVAASLGWLGLILQHTESPMPLYRALSDMAWQTSVDFLLVAIPMFVLLGEILLRAGIAERMYEGMAKWLGWLPGGLMHSNIGSSALFAATSGSSVATAATIGTVAVPQIHQRGYNESLFLGTIAAGGTLGILIPPSINLILYGLLTDTSVPELYLAGFIPGLLLALLFMATVFVLCVVCPSWGGKKLRYSWGQRLVALPDLLPPMRIFWWWLVRFTRV